MDILLIVPSSRVHRQSGLNKYATSGSAVESDGDIGPSQQSSRPNIEPVVLSVSCNTLQVKWVASSVVIWDIGMVT